MDEESKEAVNRLQPVRSVESASGSLVLSVYSLGVRCPTHTTCTGPARLALRCSCKIVPRRHLICLTLPF